MDDTYPPAFPFPPPPKHRRPFPPPPPPLSPSSEGKSPFLLSPSPSSEEPEQEEQEPDSPLPPPPKRQLHNPSAQSASQRYAQGSHSASRTGSGKGARVPAEWSKEATFALIRVWGERYLMSGKGKLNSDHWSQIAATVNAICQRKYSVLQCQNRVETLKKMYKKQKGGGGVLSQQPNWVYFEKMDALMGGGTGEVQSNGELPLDGSESDEEKENGGLGLGFRVLEESVRGIEEVFERVERKREERKREMERMRADFLEELERKQMEIFERARDEIASISDQNDHDDDVNNDDDNDDDNENDDDGDDNEDNLSD